MEVSGQLHAQAILPPGKENLVPIDRRPGGPQSQSRHSAEEKNSQPLPGLKPPIIQLIAQHYTTELSQLPSMSVWKENTYLRIHDDKVMMSLTSPLLNAPTK
jgi:hypothetical protein